MFIANYDLSSEGGYLEELALMKIIAISSRSVHRTTNNSLRLTESLLLNKNIKHKSSKLLCTHFLYKE